MSFRSLFSCIFLIAPFFSVSATAHPYTQVVDTAFHGEVLIIGAEEGTIRGAPAWQYGLCVYEPHPEAGKRKYCIPLSTCWFDQDAVFYQAQKWPNKKRGEEFITASRSNTDMASFYRDLVTMLQKIDPSCRFEDLEKLAPQLRSRAG